MQLKRGNPKAFETVTLKMAALNNQQAKVGWFETAKYPNGTPVAYAAALDELGHGKTPPRPFMRLAIIANSKKWAQIAAQYALRSIKGNAPDDEALQVIAATAEGDIIDSINKLVAPPLSPVTIELRAMKKRDPSLVVTGATVGEAARKVAQPGYQKPSVSEKPLVDSGLMVATVTHIVEKKS